MGRFGIYLAGVGGVKDLEKGKREEEEIDRLFDEADKKIDDENKEFDKLQLRLNQPKKRLDKWQNVTLDDLKRMVEEGERIEVSVGRSSGEIDDDWEIFEIGPNEKIVVKKFVEGKEGIKAGTKYVPFTLLKSWNQWT